MYKEYTIKEESRYKCRRAKEKTGGSEELKYNRDYFRGCF